ncbi:hypothetical protein GCM10023317_53870 [Actinopolymorpha pittospori]
MEWVTVYDLRRDRQRIDAVQEATLHRPGYGLDPNPAVLGTDEWWRAVADGRIPSRVDEGVVGHVRWGSMGDWPEWTLRRDDGQERTWTREGDHTRYVDGLRARIRVITVRWKPDSPSVLQLGQDPEHDMLIAVELEASDHRSDRLGPGPFPGAYDDLAPRRTLIGYHDRARIAACARTSRESVPDEPQIAVDSFCGQRHEAF